MRSPGGRSGLNVRTTGRRLGVGVAIGALSLALAATGAGAAQATPGSEAKMRICHATASASNPYTSITVSVSSLGGKGNGDHYAHPGDIIPPVNGHDGRNWDARGTAIYAAGCRAVSPADTDGDKVIDLLDLDDDGDQIPDEVDTDDDGDGINDESDPDHELTTDTDGDLIPNGLDEDDDGDGLKDPFDSDSSACRVRGAVPGSASGSDPNADADTDAIPDVVDFDDDEDGIPDFADPDRDGDDIPNAVDDDATSTAEVAAMELRVRSQSPTRCQAGQRIPFQNKATDTDGDGRPNGTDRDNDADSVPDVQDRDQDGDGIPNGRDTDADGDGAPEVRSAVLAEGVQLVRELNDGEVNQLFTGPAQTEDGLPVQVRVRCFALTPRTLYLGGGPDLELTRKSCRLTNRGSKASLEVETDGRPIRVVVTVTAPASGDVKAYRDEALYVVN